MVDQIVLIGGSAGSFSVFKKVLSQIEETDQLPIVIVMHRGGLQLENLKENLCQMCVHEVKEAEHKEAVKSNKVYIAPADYHLLINSKGEFELDYSEKVLFSRPSIDVSALSFARSFGEKLIYVVVSGANRDGAYGAKVVKRKGGRLIVQEPREAEFSQMPSTVIETCEEIDAIVHSNSLYKEIKKITYESQ